MPQIPWSIPGWFDEASAWIHEVLQRSGARIIGQIEQPHVRPWSTVLRVPTNSGDFYFKATTPTLAHEPALSAALARWRPDCMIGMVATDPRRGWLLMPDAGAMLRSLIESRNDLWRWREVLSLYANVQIEMAARAQEMLALGALDRRLRTLPAQYQQLLADEDALRIGMPDGLSREEWDRLRASVPRVAALCERLSDYHIPVTLHHEDFHDANVFVRDGHYIFTDWGESGVSYPFCTLLVTLRSIAYRLKLDADAPELLQLRDVYLQQWMRYESCERLREAFNLAYCLGMICRALTWHRTVASLPTVSRGEYGDAVTGWLQEFLDAEQRMTLV